MANKKWARRVSVIQSLMMSEVVLNALRTHFSTIIVLNRLITYLGYLTLLTRKKNILKSRDALFSLCFYMYIIYNLMNITISNSVTSIGNSTFYDCDNLQRVYYKGTKSDWSKIYVGPGNTELTVATRYYYSETKPTDQGNYWHYDTDGVTPVIW